jgi:hypothetical protein
MMLSESDLLIKLHRKYLKTTLKKAVIRIQKYFRMFIIRKTFREYVRYFHLIVIVDIFEKQSGIHDLEML